MTYSNQNGAQYIIENNVIPIIIYIIRFAVRHLRYASVRQLHINTNLSIAIAAVKYI
jgi:hypothetical protein